MIAKWKQLLISIIFIPVLAYNPISGLLKDEPKEIEPSFITDSPNKEKILGEVREYTEQEKIELIILEQAVLFGVDPDLALYLAKIESNYNPYARNPSSTAKGIYQFLDSTWLNFCHNVAPEEVYDPELNAKCAMRILSEGGIVHWLADPNIKIALKKRGFVE